MLTFYAMVALLTCSLGWAGYYVAFVIAVLLWSRVPAIFRRNHALLHWVEAWYFDDDVRDLIEPVDSDDVGGAA